MRLIRVFPRRTKATPTDPLVYIGGPDLFAEADRVHISVAFSWDVPAVDGLEREWRRIAPVEVGGPATGQRGEEFTPGLYLRDGYTITSRGCPNRCWFCSVPKRDGGIRELPIRDGWNVLDDNLLACSDQHVRDVFAMLAHQKHPIEFTGGLEAARLQDWHVAAIADLKPVQSFFAYDTPDDYEPLRSAALRIREAWPAAITGHRLRCYVLIGYPWDTMDAADMRLRAVLDLGMWPMAMLWRDERGCLPSEEWRRFQRQWARPAIIASAVR